MKCRDCKYLIGEKVSVGIECMHPEKQEKWNVEREIYRKAGYDKVIVARYKVPSTPACKKFVSREAKIDCQWR